jgi:hypothetical protein
MRFAAFGVFAWHLQQPSVGILSADGRQSGGWANARSSAQNGGSGEVNCGANAPVSGTSPIGVPRTKDGKVDLSAPAPRVASGKPDLSGVWMVEPTTREEYRKLFGDQFEAVAALDGPVTK